MCDCARPIKCQLFREKFACHQLSVGKKQNANSKDRRESGNAEKKYNLLTYKYKHGWKYKYTADSVHIGLMSMNSQMKKELLWHSLDS